MPQFVSLTCDLISVHSRCIPGSLACFSVIDSTALTAHRKL